jgi:hypothetical protein
MLMEKYEFKAGDKVTVLRNYEPAQITKVKRVMKAFIELENGTKYQPSGKGLYPRPEYSGFHNTSWNVVPWTQAHSDTIRLHNLKYKMEDQFKAAMKNLDLAKAEELWDFLTELATPAEGKDGE